MEIFLSAVLGELTTKSINFIIQMYSKPPATAVEDSLQRILLRAQVIIDEAMGRRITNQFMLQQLDMLRDSMHRGYYMLDTFKYKPCDKEDTKDLVLREALDHLSSMILDMNEVVQFLTSYPRMYCQPYNMHIQLANCMFGRQMEADHLIKFLLHRQPHGAEEPEVLPIVGPGSVGKSTLVAHVCNDDRVRDHFSKILFLRDHDFTDDLVSLEEGYAAEHESRFLKWNNERRLLIVVDFVGNLDEDSWNKLYSALKQSIRKEIKIIVTSRSDQIVKFGTTQALSLNYLSPEAYWYFFKTLTFESMDPKMHPRFMYLALEIAKTQNSSFIGAHGLACLLRDNFDIHFWQKILAFWSGFIQKHVSRFGEHPLNFVYQNIPIHLRRMATSSEELVFYREHQRFSEEEGATKIRMQDVLYGSIKPHGRFEVLAWRSRLPPYHSFVNTCEVRELKARACKRKRSIQCSHYRACGSRML